MRPGREASILSSSDGSKGVLVLWRACENQGLSGMGDNAVATPIKNAVGPLILLGSGRFFDYDNPGTSRMTIEDYAYGLAFTCRFSGQCVSRKTGRRVYYSVAQHCEIMSRAVPVGHEYAALMHESGEPVCGDLTTPLKSKLPEYRTIEKRCEKAIMGIFKVVVQDPALIQRIRRAYVGYRAATSYELGRQPVGVR